MALPNVTIELACADHGFAAAIAEMKLAIAGVPISFKKRFKLFFKSSKCIEKLARLKTDCCPAVAGKVFVCAYPTDLLLMLPAAIRAGEFDHLVIKETHEISPVGGFGDS